MNGTRDSLALLTRLPVGPVERYARYTAAWFWVPGLMAGIVWYIAFHLFGSTGAGMIAAVGGEAVLTGGMHWQGWAKALDGWSGSPAQRRQARRSWAVGPVGVLFLGLALLAFWTLWQHASALVPVVWILPPLWGRAIVAWGTSWRGVDPSSARMAKLSEQAQHGAGAWISLVIGLGLGVLMMGFRAVDTFGVTLVVTGLFMWWGVRRFGGMNEELLYGVVILAEIAALYVIVATTPLFM
jgi:adenosylcobinamide-GDP ribazoletransferase